MALEEYQNILYPIIDIFAVLTVIFASLLLYEIKKHKREIKYKKILVIVFSLLAVGFLFDAIAEVTWDFISRFLGQSPELGIPDIFWIIGELLLFTGFTYFAVYMYKQHGKLKQGIFMMFIAGIISILIIYYLITNFILGYQAGESAFEMFIDYFYPIVSALILIATVSVYLFFRELKEIGIPLILFAISRFFTFTADMLYTYYSWNDIYGIAGVLSDSFYGVEYILSTLAFYLLLKKWVGVKSIGKEIKEIFGLKVKK